MPLSLFSMSKTVPLHNDGSIVPGGLLHFYTTGTTTRKDTYADAEGLIPNMNPVVLDGAGRADIFLADDAGYDVVFTDEDNVTIWTLTNVVSATSASTGLATAPSANTIVLGGIQPALQTPIGRGDLVLYCNNGTLLEIRGIDAGYDGQALFIHAIGLGQIDIINQSVSAAAANRIINPYSGTVSLAPNSGSAHLIYDGTTARWRVFQHNQGNWIPYTVEWKATGGGVPVMAGGYLKGRYFVDGRGCSFWIELYWGIGTVGPNNFWVFSLPPLPIEPIYTPIPVAIHDSAVGEIAGMCEIGNFTGALVVVPYAVNAVNGCGPNNPFVWKPNDMLRIGGIVSLI